MPTQSQYWLTPVSVVQVNVTVDEESTEPGAGETIWASATAPGVLVTVGVRVLVGV